MVRERLAGKRIAILATDGFEESELFSPLKALEDAGARVEVISLKTGKIKGWKDNEWAKSISVDRLVAGARAENYDGLMLPGGVINADQIRNDRAAVKFVGTFMRAGRPIAAICHAAWALIETGLLGGRTLTSWGSLKTDLRNAGATWVDKEVVVDHGLVSSRCPDDLPAFNLKMIEEFAEGLHTPQGSGRIVKAHIDPSDMVH
jgi:protease I